MGSAEGAHFDALVVGGGAAGSVLAARLSEDTSRTVCLLEAGPDYGPSDSVRWPADLLDPDEYPSSHDWGIEESSQFAVRARVIGGCTTHNCCYLSIGSPGDYDEWEELGNLGWSWATMQPFLERVQSTLPTCRPSLSKAHPWKRSVVQACADSGIEVLADFNDSEHPLGVGSVPRNISGGVRWNAAFAYLDPARKRSNLHIEDEALVDRIELGRNVAQAAVFHAGGHEQRLTADLIILAAGAFCSPALLLRSGIGSEDSLRRHSIPVMSSLPGVGRELSDHSGVAMSFGRTERYLSDTEAWLADLEPPQPVVVLKAGSSACDPGSWDLHVTPVASSTDYWQREAPGRGRTMMTIYLMKPASRGSVDLAARDASVPPRVEHGFFSDHEGEDLRALGDGCEIARDLAAHPAARPYVYQEKIQRLREPGPNNLAAQLSTEPYGYWHPTGTCRMGPADDPGSVVDGNGRVHGIQNLFVADASILPTIPRANPALTVLAVAEKIAEGLRS
jgi:choline dehydrogenase